MGKRAAQDRHESHTRKWDISGVLSLPCDEGVIELAWNTLADEAIRALLVDIFAGTISRND